ncbi:MAG: hypothetical protein RQ736_03415 [Thiogranum sp.]|nr:hypothetical protein [Thiogranum sp.]
MMQRGSGKNGRVLSKTNSAAIRNDVHSAARLRHCVLHAVDGEVGVLQELYFDDVTWTLRYLAVAAGHSPDQQLLIPPLAVGEIFEHRNLIHIELEHEQIEASPPVSSRRSVSQGDEERLYRYYGWPRYWDPALTDVPRSTHRRTPAVEMPRVPVLRSEQTRLHGAGEITGCTLMASNGEVGRIRDIVIDARYWAIRYLQVDAGDRLLVISPGWIEMVDWVQRSLRVDLTHEAMCSAPPYDQNSVERDYDVQLSRHYRRHNCR